MGRKHRAGRGFSWTEEGLPLLQQQCCGCGVVSGGLTPPGPLLSALPRLCCCRDAHVNAQVMVLASQADGPAYPQYRSPHVLPLCGAARRGR